MLRKCFFFNHMTDTSSNDNMIRIRVHLPSPCLSVNWKACTSRSVSSTERPTGRSLMVIWRRLPLSSIINKPLKPRKQVQLIEYEETGKIYQNQLIMHKPRRVTDVTKILTCFVGHFEWVSQLALQLCYFNIFFLSFRQGCTGIGKKYVSLCVGVGVCVCAFGPAFKARTRVNFLHSKWGHFDKARSKFQSSLCDYVHCPHSSMIWV